jgi:Fur family ferric uptake transcriptional regulator
LEALKKSKTHTTADELIDILKTSGEKVSRATVYRYLKELVETGRVKKYSLGEKNSSCYSFVGENSDCHEHYHLMCEGCGKLEHIESDVMKSFADSAKKCFGFEIDEGKTVFYGKCKNCLKGESK